MFCFPDSSELYLNEDSPCAPFSPENPGCDLSGAWPVGCGPLAIDETPHSQRRPRLAASPNPFRGFTRIVCTTPSRFLDPHARLLLSDAGGRVVRVFPTTGRFGEGVLYDGTDGAGNRLPAGVYFLTLRSGGMPGPRSIARNEANLQIVLIR